MKFTAPKFLISLVVTVVAGALLVGGLRSFGVIGGKGDPDDPATLVRDATQALEAVRNRQPGDRRPASYDAVLAPLDKLLTLTKKELAKPDFDPVTDYEKLRSLTLPVIDLATQADAQARTETGFLTKEYRFNAQKGEACQYLANAMWERINRRMPQQPGFFTSTPQYPQHDMQELASILDTGVAAAPQNADLFYIRGVVNKAQGLFAPAARDLEKAVELNADFPAAYNVLGLTRIHLRQFEAAEDALERARALELDIASRLQQDPGSEYTAIVYNLASFHEGLAAYYGRENRITPTVESQRLTIRHSDEARRYFEEFLKREPADSPDAKTALGKLQALSR